MSDLNAAAAAPPGHLELDMLQTLLMHAPDLLSTRELGRLSLCSKNLLRISDDAGVWKGLFDKAVAAGETCVDDRRGDSHGKVTWNGEPGILSCFAHPSPQILERVGYKHAAGCLLSKTCFYCCTMAGHANPLTMTRICKACTEEQESSWAITKSKAKEAFLLTDKDCTTFPSAPFPFGFCNASGTCVLFLLIDVMTASFAKWGGPDGLESEITKRTAAAASRYAKRQRSAKPQKKRPMIESLSSRPADDLSSVRSFFGSALPIPVSFFKFSDSFPPLHETFELKMTHCTICSLCAVRGTKKDIDMHERLEHGVFTSSLEDEEMNPTPVGDPRMMPESIQPAEELVQLLEQAEVKCDASRFENEYMGIYGNCSFCLFTLGDCKVSVMRSEGGCEGVGGGRVVIWYQTGQKMLPVELASIGFGECGDDTSEADEVFFEKLKEALQLRETTSSQLLAAVIWHGIPNLKSNALYGLECDDKKTPVFCHALELLGLPGKRGW